MDKKEAALNNLKQMEAIYQKACATLKALDENIADLQNMDDDILVLQLCF